MYKALSAIFQEFLLDQAAACEAAATVVVATMKVSTSVGRAEPMALLR